MARESRPENQFLILGSKSGLICDSLVRKLGQRPYTLLQRGDFDFGNPDWGKLKASLTNKPRAMVILSAMTNMDECVKKRTESRAVNWLTPLEASKRAADHGVPVIFLSSDAVFDGKKEQYFEEDPVTPINTYGELKAKAEEGIRALQARSLIFRMSKVISMRADNVLAKQVSELRSGKTIPCFTDQCFAPVWSQDVADAICRAVERNEGGTFHLAQDDLVSRYEIGGVLAHAIDASLNLVEGRTMADFRFEEPRAFRVHLRNRKARERLGLNFLDLRKGVAQYFSNSQGLEDRNFGSKTEIL